MITEDSSADYFDKTTKDLLRCIASENELVYCEVRNNAKSVRGDGFLGVVTGVELICKDKENKKKILNVVVKSASKSDALRAQLPLSDLYNREVYAYNVIFKTLEQFEIDKNLIPTLVAPKFYKANLEDKKEMLILENLKEIGYNMYGRKKAMDAQHVTLVLQKYGQFHALGLAFRDQNLEEFKQVTNSMDELFMEFLEKGNFIQLLKNVSIKSLKSLHESTDMEAYRIYKDHINNIDEILNDVRNAINEDYITIIHGDCWTNNFMFKYDDSGNPSKVTGVRFLDFQLTRLGPPVLDLLYFFYSSSEKELINNLEVYLRVYYNSLSSHLIRLGSNPDTVYPYSVFWKQWKKYARFGLLIAQPVIQVMVSEEDEIVDFTNAAEENISLGVACNYEFANTGLFYDRIRHIILHFIKNKFI